MGSKQWGSGYHKGYADAIKKTGGLIGLFFHTYSNGKIYWQGHIEQKLDSGSYLVQLFSWLTGEPTDKKIVNDSEMKDWSFYDSNEAMRLSYYRSQGLTLDESKRIDAIYS
jgi:hypothetical protein